MPRWRGRSARPRSADRGKRGQEGEAARVGKAAPVARARSIATASNCSSIERIVQCGCGTPSGPPRRSTTPASILDWSVPRSGRRETAWGCGVSVAQHSTNHGEDGGHSERLGTSQRTQSAQRKATRRSLWRPAASRRPKVILFRGRRSGQRQVPALRRSRRVKERCPRGRGSVAGRWNSDRHTDRSAADAPSRYRRRHRRPTAWDRASPPRSRPRSSALHVDPH
jgi:hypothetical protein